MFIFFLMGGCHDILAAGTFKHFRKVIRLAENQITTSINICGESVIFIYSLGISC